MNISTMTVLSLLCTAISTLATNELARSNAELIHVYTMPQEETGYGTQWAPQPGSMFMN